MLKLYKLTGKETIFHNAQELHNKVVSFKEQIISKVPTMKKKRSPIWIDFEVAYEKDLEALYFALFKDYNNKYICFCLEI